MSLTKSMMRYNYSYLDENNKKSGYFANSLNYSLRKRFKEKNDFILDNKYNIFGLEKNK